MKTQGVLIAERIIKGLFNSPFDEMFEDLNITEYEDGKLSFEEFLKKYFWKKKGEDINLYPSNKIGGCHKILQIFSFSEKPRFAKGMKQKEMISFEKSIHILVQHMVGKCPEITEEATLTTDKIDTDIIKPWLSTIREIQKRKKIITILFVNDNGEITNANKLLGLR